jgi:hypothetical protein
MKTKVLKRIFVPRRDEGGGKSRKLPPVALYGRTVS